MIILDTSAAVELVRQTPDGQALKQLMLRNEKAISCDLLRAEAASTFRKLARVEGFSTAQAEAYYSGAIQLVDEFSPMDELEVEVLREAIRLDHSVYDMYYFVLARRTGGTLFTLDRKLAQLCAENGVDCIMQMELS